MVKTAQSHNNTHAALIWLGHPGRNSATAQEISKLLKTTRIVRIVCIFLMLAGIATAIVAAESVFSTRVRNPDNPLGQTSFNLWVKWVSTILTAVLLVMMCVKASLNFQMLAVQGVLIPHQSFFDTTLARNLAIELLVCAVHCPAHVYALIPISNPIDIVISYDLDSLLSMLQFFRLLMVITMIINELSGFSGSTSRQVQRNLHVSFDTKFALSHLLDLIPISGSLLVYAFTVGVLTYALRVAERPICFTEAASMWCVKYKDMNSAFNSAWCIVITTLTVGYGDFVPYTQIGRCVSTVAALVGIIIIALLVNAVSLFTRFNPDENRARGLIERHVLGSKHKRLASALVAASIAFGVDRMRNGGARSNKKVSFITSENPLVARRSQGAGSGRPLPARFLQPGAPSRHSLHKLALALNSWSSHTRKWIDVQRCRDSGDVVKRDVDSLKREVDDLRDSLKSVHEKLDVLLRQGQSGGALVFQALPPKQQQ